MSDTLTYEGYNNLYLNITNRCTARCEFCIKHYADGVYGYNLRLTQEPTLNQIITALQQHELSQYREIVFAGFGEPLTRLDDVLFITRWLKRHNAQVRVDTIGHVKLYHPHRNIAAELKKAGLDTISISLNAHNEETYNQLCRPANPQAYHSMLSFARDAKKAGIRTRLTIVNLPVVDIEECMKIAEEIGADFKIRGYGGRR
jgi:TatD family-associated radical SAM protein